MSRSKSRYPKGWRIYCSLCKESGTSPGDLWAIYAARFRIADACLGVKFKDGIAENTRASYQAAIIFTLAYNCLESSARASGLKINDLEINELDPVFNRSRKYILENLINKKNSLPLMHKINNPKLKRRLLQFINSDSQDLMPLASYLRHLFSHGVWTVYGGGANSISLIKSIESLSQVLLIKSELILRDFTEKRWPDLKKDRLSKLYKKAFDRYSDLAYEYLISSSKDEEIKLVLTRIGANSDYYYLIQLDKYSSKLDTWMNLREESSDLASFYSVIGTIIAEGGIIDDVYGNEF